MNITLRTMPRLAAAAGVAAALCIISPATAADADGAIRQPASMVSAKTASASVKRHQQHWPRYHLASWYSSHVHVADAGTTPRSCFWFCGRPFVLMVGVAY